MYNSELDMEKIASASPAHEQDDAWADIAAKITDDKAQNASPCVDSAQRAVASSGDVNSMQSPDGGNGRAGTKGDASQSQPARGQSPERGSTDLAPTMLRDILRGTRSIQLPELSLDRKTEPAPASPHKDSPVQPKGAKPAGNPVQELTEIAVPGIAVAKALAPGAKAAAKAGEKIVEKAVIAPAEKVKNEVIRAADDAAKALEEASKRTADELARKANEARRAIDEAARKTADDAAKAFDLVFGKPRK